MTVTSTKIRRLARIVGSFRQHNPSMTAPMMLAFLTIAAKPGCSTADVGEALGMAGSTASRNVNALTKAFALHGKKQSGPDLITNKLDPFNMRRRVLTLTPKGQALLDALGDYVGE